MYYAGWGPPRHPSVGSKTKRLFPLLCFSGQKRRWAPASPESMSSVQCNIVCSAQPCVGFNIFRSFVHSLSTRPLDVCAQGVCNALTFTLWPVGISGDQVFFTRLSFGLQQLHTRAAPVSYCGKWLPPLRCLVAEWKPWQQEAGRIFVSPGRKGSLFLGPEPSYSLVLHFAVNFNSGELALRVLGLSLGGLDQRPDPLLSPKETQLLASTFKAVLS